MLGETKKKKTQLTKANVDIDRHAGVVVLWDYVLMILPQVHLRKPCYDFSFLEMFRFK